MCGQKFHKTRSYLALGEILRFNGCTSQTGQSTSQTSWRTGQTSQTGWFIIGLFCLVLPPAELDCCSAISFETCSISGTILSIEPADVYSMVGFSLPCVKFEFLFNRPSFLTR